MDTHADSRNTSEIRGCQRRSYQIVAGVQPEHQRLKLWAVGFKSSTRNPDAERIACKPKMCSTVTYGRLHTIATNVFMMARAILVRPGSTQR